MALDVPPVQELGVFAAGEIPPAITHQYLDRNNAAIDITGFEVDAFITSRPAQVNLGEGAAALFDAANGIVKYTWAAEDMAAVGSYRLQIWVWDDPMTQRYASDIFAFEVYEGVGPE